MSVNVNTANGLCPAGKATLGAHADRLERLEVQDDRMNDKLDGIAAKLNTLLVAVVVLSCTLAANLAQKLLGG